MKTHEKSSSECNIMGDVVYNAASPSSPSLQSKGQVRKMGLGFGHEAHGLDAGELENRSKHTERGREIQNYLPKSLTAKW